VSDVHDDLAQVLVLLKLAGCVEDVIELEGSGDHRLQLAGRQPAENEVERCLLPRGIGGGCEQIVATDEKKPGMGYMPGFLVACQGGFAGCSHNG
jgi:hypothetical protein